MKVMINGEARQIADTPTISALMEQLGIAQDQVAIEHNHTIIPKSQYDNTTLNESDTIEIVRFIGGG